jgi:hypothetical protein
MLYISGLDGVLYSFSYPNGKLISTVTVPSLPEFICSDSSGNVFVPTEGSRSQSNVYEYAHGGTSPIAVLNDPGSASSCAVNPTTGNVAVTNGNSVAVFQSGQGQPTVYQASDVGAFASAYDDAGNLFVDNTRVRGKVAELPAGGSTFTDISLTQSFNPGSLQWRDGSLVIAAQSQSAFGPLGIYEATISGGIGTISGPVLLRGRNDKNPKYSVQFLLQQKWIIGPDHTSVGDARAFFWLYPKGGKAVKSLGKKGGGELLGVTLSR